VADEPEDETSLNERLLDVFVYAPLGLVIAAVEEFPKLAELGRHKLGTQVNSARAVGHFAVVTGRKELHRRSGGVRRRPAPGPAPAPGGTGLRSVGTEPGEAAAAARPAASSNGSSGPAAPSPGTPHVSLHVPGSAELAIPAYDTLSASQVVQRLDGLSRGQLVTARAYEAGTRGRRTILSRIDQLLDERA
jgi:hypothetical protein